MAQNYEKIPTWKIFARALLPSFPSLVGSLLGVLAIVGFHLLLLSQQADLLLPHLAGESNDQLAEIYQTSVLGPLNRAFGNNWLGILSTALVWGAVGFVAYSIMEYVITLIREWQSSDKDINVQSPKQIVRHPLQRQLVTRMLWRFFIGILLVVLTVALQPAVSSLLRYDIEFLRADTWLEMAKNLGLVCAGWFAIFHCYIVLFRLFVFRTRVFGEIIY